MAWLNVVLHILCTLYCLCRTCSTRPELSLLGSVGWSHQFLTKPPTGLEKKGTEEKTTHKTDDNNCCNCDCSDLWINMETKRIGIDQTNTLTDGRAWFTSGVCTTGSQKIMQWFALEMQHNAQNALYCTIDAHYAKLKSQTKCTKLLHIYIMK